MTILIYPKGVPLDRPIYQGTAVRVTRRLNRAGKVAFDAPKFADTLDQVLPLTRYGVRVATEHGEYDLADGTYDESQIDGGETNGVVISGSDALGLLNRRLVKGLKLSDKAWTSAARFEIVEPGVWETHYPNATDGDLSTSTPSLTIDNGHWPYIASPYPYNQLFLYHSPAGVARDDFRRTESGGLGVTDQELIWGGYSNAELMSVDQPDGLTARGIATFAFDGTEIDIRGSLPIEALDADARIDFRVDRLPPAGEQYYGAIRLRDDGAGNWYRCRIGISSDGAVRINLNAPIGKGGSLATYDSALTVVAGQWISFRFRVEGESPAEVKARVWDSEAAEPAAWDVTASQTEAALDVVGGLTLIGAQDFGSPSIANMQWRSLYVAEVGEAADNPPDYSPFYRVQMYDDESAGWEDCEIIRDDTLVNGVPWSQSGIMEWELPDILAPVRHSGLEYYWMRIIPAASITNTLQIAEIELYVDGPTDDAPARILEFAPTGWGLNPAFHKRTSIPIRRELVDGVTVLDALIDVAGATGDTFRLSKGGATLVDWLRNDTFDAQVLAVGGSQKMGVSKDYGHVCYITKLTEQRDFRTRATRVYLYGGGSGSDRVTLANTTLAPPSGYTLNAAESYLDRDLLPGEDLIETQLTISEITSESASGGDDDPIASNELFQVGLEYLQSSSQVDGYQAVDIEVAGLHREVFPGEYIFVDFRDVRQKKALWEVRGYFTVIESTVEQAGGGVRTTKMKVTTEPRWPRSEQNILASAVKNVTSANSGARRGSGGIGRDEIQKMLNEGTVQSALHRWSGGKPSVQATSAPQIAAALRSMGLIDTY